MGPDEIVRLKDKIQKTPKKERNTEVPDNGGLEALVPYTTRFPPIRFGDTEKPGWVAPNNIKTTLSTWKAIESQMILKDLTEQA